MYTRYLHLKIAVSQNLWMVRFNKLGFSIGIMSCFGLTVVGNFQETNQITVHLIGA